MKFVKSFIFLLILSFSLLGCYTILTHPAVQKNEYVYKVKFYNDCSACHSAENLMDYGHYYLNRQDDIMFLGTSQIWISPSYSAPWWIGHQPLIENNQSESRSNDQTRLRNLDGGRTSTPTDFSIPSRNTGTTNNAFSSSNETTNNTNDSKKDRNTRSSETLNSRNNSGERKK